MHVARKKKDQVLNHQKNVNNVVANTVNVNWGQDIFIGSYSVKHVLKCEYTNLTLSLAVNNLNLSTYNDIPFFVVFKYNFDIFKHRFSWDDKERKYA